MNTSFENLTNEHVKQKCANIHDDEKKLKRRKKDNKRIGNCTFFLSL